MDVSLEHDDRDGLTVRLELDWNVTGAVSNSSCLVASAVLTLGVEEAELLGQLLTSRADQLRRCFP